jgi:hypothetical protein
MLDKLTGVGAAWLVFGPVWLTTVGALGWGERVLTGTDLWRGLRRTGLLSLSAFPIVSGVYAYYAGLDHRPTVSPMISGVQMAMLCLPLYSAVLAWPVFHTVLKAAGQAGAPLRPLPIRVLASLALVLGMLFSVGALLFLAMLAAAPEGRFR